MNRKRKAKDEDLKEDKIFVEYWKERMKMLVIETYLLPYRKTTKK